MSLTTLSVVISIMMAVSVGLSVPLYFRRPLRASTELALRVFSNIPIIVGGVAGLYTEGLDVPILKAMFWIIILSGSALVLWQLSTRKKL